MGRRMTVLMAAVVLGLAAGCDDDATGPETVPPLAPLQVTLPLGQEVQVDGSALRLVFTRVVEDSRCPVDVVCVWEGNAVVEVSVALGSGPSTPLQINSTLEPRSASWNGIRLTFRELTPRPRSEGPPPDDYELRVLVEPTGG